MKSSNAAVAGLVAGAGAHRVFPQLIRPRHQDSPGALPTVVCGLVKQNLGQLAIVGGMRDFILAESFAGIPEHGKKKSCAEMAVFVRMTLERWRLH